MVRRNVISGVASWILRERAAEPLDLAEPSVLAVLPHGPDRPALQRIVCAMGWNARSAADCEEAAALLDAHSFPVVLYDREMGCRDWRKAFDRLRATRYPACLVLTSTVSDGLLWEEVIQHGGFDVLTRPFDEVQTPRTLQFALSHWKTGWLRRDRDRFVWK